MTVTMEDVTLEFSVITLLVAESAVLALLDTLAMAFPARTSMSAHSTMVAVILLPTALTLMAAVNAALALVASLDLVLLAVLMSMNALPTMAVATL